MGEDTDWQHTDVERPRRYGKFNIEAGCDTKEQSTGVYSTELQNETKSILVAWGKIVLYYFRRFGLDLLKWPHDSHHWVRWFEKDLLGVAME